MMRLDLLVIPYITLSQCRPRTACPHVLVVAELAEVC